MDHEDEAVTSPLNDPLAAAVVVSGGQPATVRVGTITALSPTRVTMGGTVLDPDVVGFARDYSPVLGDVVALLGQSVEGADSSGSTWLVVGTISLGGPSPRNEISMLARRTRTTFFDSAIFTVAGGEILVGGGLGLSVPVKAGHLTHLGLTFHHSNTSGVAATTRIKIREDTLAGAVVGGKDYIPGVGNLYIGGRLDVWFRATVTKTQLYVITAQSPVVGNGQWGFGTSDLFWADEYGLNEFVALS